MGLESSFPDSVTSMVPNFDTKLCEEYLDYFYEDPSWKNDTTRLTNKDWGPIVTVNYIEIAGVN